MPRPIAAPLALLLLAAPAAAGDAAPGHRSPARAFCAHDLTAVPLIRGTSPARPSRFAEGAIRPGLLHVQSELCRCLPPRRRHHQLTVRAGLHIAPNAGEVTVKYRVEGPEGRAASRARARMRQCLGQPTLQVEPLPYRTDMVTDDGPVEEVLLFPIQVNLELRPETDA